MPGKASAVLAVLALALGALFGLAGPSRAAGSQPCDIYGDAGTPCVAAHSTVRALLSSYGGPLHQVNRASDGATADIEVLSPGGCAYATRQDMFCGDTTCRITKIYDQTARHNDLIPAPVTWTRSASRLRAASHRAPVRGPGSGRIRRTACSRATTAPTRRTAATTAPTSRRC